ncbi:carbohydrate ABC transporter permease [Gracilibacillus massiliensis]|uniref:carbohydrate ABC transporter permease n=1 Tax=Gracilibacillus massiliensis TaxID=1564956 RepID=UPI00071E663E|nr:sugar ABC transporter permease [Gracilibacillus massiliensis]
MKSRFQWQYQIFLIPILIVYTLLMVYPLLKAFYYSLTDFGGYDRNFSFVGLDNYIKLFSDSAIVQSLGFTLYYAILSTIIITVLAIPLAIVLDTKFIGRNFARAAFFFPAIPSTLLLGFVWGFILSPISTGVLNNGLETLFNIGPIPWLSDPDLARISTIIVATWNQTGWHAIIYLAFLQAIPKDFYEAAEIDGANAWQKFRKITVPLLAPAMTISVMLLLTNGLKVYEMPFALTSGGPGYSTYTLTQVIIQRGVAESNFSLASALSIVFFVLVLFITIFQVTIMQKREEKIQ